jgi:hypothetical protein
MASTPVRWQRYPHWCVSAGRRRLNLTTKIKSDEPRTQIKGVPREEIMADRPRRGAESNTSRIRKGHRLDHQRGWIPCRRRCKWSS